MQSIADYVLLKDEVSSVHKEKLSCASVYLVSGMHFTCIPEILALKLRPASYFVICVPCPGMRLYSCPTLKETVPVIYCQCALARICSLDKKERENKPVASFITISFFLFSFILANTIAQK